MPTNLNGAALSANTKKQIRIEMRQRRRMLTVEQQDAAAISLTKNIFKLHGISGTRRIGAYLANDGEIDPLPAMLEWSRRGQQCFLPILFPGQKPRLRFASFSMRSRMFLNRFGIPEPCVSQRACLDPLQLDWIFVPLVAFDSSGHRLGMGGGYYDASLAVLRMRAHWRKPRLVGLAHEFQRIDHLAVDEWDVPLHGILTNERFYPAPGAVWSPKRTIASRP
jgi:5-formyltetrahydrofolate cyclo-ligase